MNVFLQPLSELEELQNALKQLKSNQGIVQISGCMDAQKAHMVFAANDGFRNKIIFFLTGRLSISRRRIFYFISRISEVISLPESGLPC